MKNLFYLSLFCLSISVVTLSSPAFAHKIRIFAWQEGNTISTESKFSGGRPAKNVSLTIINPTSLEKLLVGTTDEAGLFSFPVPIPQPTELEIIIDSGDGHKNSWTHVLESSSSPALSRPSKPSEALTTETSPTLVSLSTNNVTGVDMTQLTETIETILDKKLAPIKKALAEQNDKGPSMQDILGGIGYIFGLAGIAAYFKSQKK